MNIHIFNAQLQNSTSTQKPLRACYSNNYKCKYKLIKQYNHIILQANIPYSVHCCNQNITFFKKNVYILTQINRSDVTAMEDRSNNPL